MPTPQKSLIEKLNSAAADAQNPDQIVAILNHNGWIKGSNIPHDLAQKWYDEDVPVAICYGRDGGTFSFTGTHYRMRSFPPDYVSEHLTNHWLMLQSEFESRSRVYPNGEPI